MKPENAQKILKSLKEAGVRLIVSLPDSWLVDLEELAKKDANSNVSKPSKLNRVK